MLHREFAYTDRPYRLDPHGLNEREVLTPPTPEDSSVQSFQLRLNCYHESCGEVEPERCACICHVQARSLHNIVRKSDANPALVKALI